MTIHSGTRLGPYEVIAPIGAGGMGEVYRARDTRLDRTVAVKILPAEFAHNAQLRMRFEREAKTISQLSHPNICTLYDVGDGYLVMELLEGESLADRITRGALPLGDVLRYGAQIAEALGKAHRAGVVHRDLKPANVMLTKAGAKLLDFGLAKSDSQVIDIDGATRQKSLTAEGTILGTFQYMAPEQLEGADADARTDIFALGALLYEMATGRRAFDGKTKTSLIASIVSGGPKPLSAVQPLTPPALEHTIAKCLEKDPDARWQNAYDVAEELRWVAAQPATVTPTPRSLRAGWLAAVAIALAAAAAVALMVWRRPQPRLVYSAIVAPEDSAFVFDNGAAAISPDAMMIVFPASSHGVTSLHLRRFDEATGRALPGTEGALYPFWSPDSKSIGFFSDGKMKRFDLSSGTIESIADAPSGRGGAWNADNTILFAASPAGGLVRVQSTGGTPQPVTQLDPVRGDASHRYPIFLPDGRHFLTFVQGPSDGGNVILGSLDSDKTKVVATADAGVVFAPPDYLLIVHDRVLRAQRINLRTFALAGDPVPLAENTQVSTTFNFANVSASKAGVITYTNGVSATNSELVFVDATGKRLGTVGSPTDQLDPRISPDGSAVVVAQNANTTQTTNVVMFDLRRNIPTRLTFSTANDFSPVWSPDGKSIVYTTFDRRPGDLFVKRVDGSASAELLLADKRRKIVTDWTPDGKYVIYNVVNAKTLWDIEAYSIPEHKTIPLVTSAAADMEGRVSADEKWLTYVTAQGGHPEVFMKRFPPTDEQWQVSGGGGTMPVWSRDGKQLFYIGLDGKMMAAAVHISGNQFVADTPRALFMTGIRMLQGITRVQYDVAPDGRFLINTPTVGAQNPIIITLVQNWTEKLRGQ